MTSMYTRAIAMTLACLARVQSASSWSSSCRGRPARPLLRLAVAIVVFKYSSARLFPYNCYTNTKALHNHSTANENAIACAMRFDIYGSVVITTDAATAILIGGNAAYI